MWKRFALRKVEAFERQFGYDARYMKELLKTSPSAFLRLSRLQAISAFRRGVPLEAWYAAKLVGALAEDCGPCAQLVVDMARTHGVPLEGLKAVAEGRESDMADEVRLAFRYARAAVSREPTDELRFEVVQRWGPEGHVSLALALFSARVYPILKYALGHGQSCSRLRFDDASRTVVVHAHAEPRARMS